MSQSLKRRQVVMQAHLDDEPKSVDHSLYSANTDAFLHRG